MIKELCIICILLVLPLSLSLLLFLKSSDEMIAIKVLGFFIILVSVVVNFYRIITKIHHKVS